MANGLTINGRSFKAISTVALTRLDDYLIFNWASPSGFQISEGIEQKEQEGLNDYGERVRINNFPIARKPTLTISYQNINPEMISWKMGNYLETGSYTTRFPIRVWVTKAEFPGAASGNRGYGIAEDVSLGTADAPRAAVTRGELSVALTQAAWADYSTWRTDLLTFAVGANGALLFSDDVVTAQDVVTLSIPVAGEMTRISDILVGIHRIEALVVDSLDKVHYLEVYQAIPDLSNAALDFTADTLEINMFLNNPPGYCRAWNMYSPKTNNQVVCAG
ncbi:MAG TPA: hypothetical protein V6C65_04395 [Allocoleopsis sp.]